MPQVNFHLPAGAGTTGRGLVRGFRYGLVMPGGSRIVIDLAGPAKVTNSYVLDSANGQPPRLVVDVEEVDRATFVQTQGVQPQAMSQGTPPGTAQGTQQQGIQQGAATGSATTGLPGRSEPARAQAAISDSHAAITAPQIVPAPPQPAAPPDPRPVVVIDPRTWRGRQRHPIRHRDGENRDAGLWPGVA